MLHNQKGVKIWAAVRSSIAVPLCSELSMLAGRRCVYGVGEGTENLGWKLENLIKKNPFPFRFSFQKFCLITDNFKINIVVVSSFYMKCV